MRRSAALPLALMVVAALPPGSARAYEDQVTLGLDAGYALALGDGTAHGVTAGLEASIGLGDVLSLRGRLGYGHHPGGDGLHVAVAGGELLYVLDVLEWVPYFGLGADAFMTVASGDARGDLGLHAVVGLEWLGSRDWLVGLDIRPYLLPLAFDEDPLDPVYLSITLRYSLIFDL
ncbi:MAG: hypothetical protein ACOC97_00335 [Myxococcota bacterium]